MEAFPFTRAEWAAVHEASLAVVNAALAEDPVLRAHHSAALFDLLEGLRARHGDHPVLLETQADLADDPAERVELYRRAAAVAGAHGLPTLSVRLSLARDLLEGGDAGAALTELRACEPELAVGDESEQAEWHELTTSAGRR